MYLDTEILGRLPKRSMSGRWDDPKTIDVSGLEQSDIRGRAHISGLMIPLLALAQSRCVLTDMRIDSVPPEVADVISMNILKNPYP
jgi:hypothetical protein